MLGRSISISAKDFNSNRRLTPAEPLLAEQTQQRKKVDIVLYPTLEDGPVVKLKYLPLYMLVKLNVHGHPN